MKRANTKKVLAWWKYLLLILPCFIFLFPVFVLLTRSFFTNSELTTIGAGIFSKNPTFDNYKEALSNKDFLNGLKNSLIICACSVIGGPLTAFMAAYAFTKVKFTGRKFWFMIGIGTVMIPGVLLQLPCYKIFVDIGWYDTLLPLTIPCFFGGGILNIFMIMQFIRSIPKEVYEAATLDGANTFKKMFRITMPVIRPIIILMMVNSFFGAWTDLTGPLLYIQSPENYTVTLYIFEQFLCVEEAESMRMATQMAIGVLLMIPMVIVYCIFQKQLINGLKFGAVKE